MSLPRGDEYFTAIQNPRIVFQDADLKACKVETDQIGLPKAYSGGFTTTFHLSNNIQHWAVRCFTREIKDLQCRYKAIGKFLENNKNDIFVKTTFLQDGILINGRRHPIIKMQWLEGLPLSIFITQNIRNPSKISKLPDEFLKMVQTLEKLGVAHGDLQHGNIMIKNGKFYLIDYDGFFVPELSGKKANEMGHVNYQHSQRNESNFDAKIDHFSSIVIYLGLKAIAISPKLWTKYDNT